MKLVTLIVSLALGVLPSTTPRVSVVANGGTQFVFTFKTFASSHIKVYVNNVPQVGGYAVSLNANQDSSPGGTVAFTHAPATGSTVRIDRVLPYAQDSSWTSFSKAKSLELDLDRMTMRDQQLSLEQSDAIAAALAANTFAADAVAAAQAAVKKAQAGLQVTDFGAVCNDIADDTNAFNLAIAAAAAVGMPLYLPAGTCRVNSKVEYHGWGLMLIGQGMRKSKIHCTPSTPGSTCVSWTNTPRGTSYARNNTWKGFTIQADTVNTSVTAEIVDQDHFFMQDVWIIGGATGLLTGDLIWSKFTESAVMASWGTGNIVYDPTLTGLSTSTVWNQMYISNASAGGVGMRIGNAMTTDILNSIFEYNTGGGLTVGADSDEAAKVKIVASHFEGNSNFAIQAGDDVQVEPTEMHETYILSVGNDFGMALPDPNQATYDAIHLGNATFDSVGDRFVNSVRAFKVHNKCKQTRDVFVDGRTTLPNIGLQLVVNACPTVYPDIPVHGNWNGTIIRSETMLDRGSTNYYGSIDDFVYGVWTTEGKNSITAPVVTPNATLGPDGVSSATRVDFPAVAVNLDASVVEGLVTGLTTTMDGTKFNSTFKVKGVTGTGTIYGYLWQLTNSRKLGWTSCAWNSSTWTLCTLGTGPMTSLVSIGATDQLQLEVGNMDYVAFSGTTSLGAPGAGFSVYLADAYVGKDELEPDIARGDVKNITLSRDVKFIAPVVKPTGSAPVSGQMLTVNFKQDGTGGRAVTWDPIYVMTWTDSGNTANSRASTKFQYDGTNWVQQSFTTWWK